MFGASTPLNTLLPGEQPIVPQSWRNTDVAMAPQKTLDGIRERTTTKGETVMEAGEWDNATKTRAEGLVSSGGTLPSIALQAVPLLASAMQEIDRLNEALAAPGLNLNDAAAQANSIAVECGEAGIENLRRYALNPSDSAVNQVLLGFRLAAYNAIDIEAEVKARLAEARAAVAKQDATGAGEAPE